MSLMLLLREIGIDGLRERLNAERQRELQSLALESVPLGQVPGTVQRASGSDQLPRKVNAAARLYVDAQQHLSLLRGYVARFYTDETVRSQVLSFVDRSNNLLRMVTDRAAVAYSVPPSRTLRNVAEDQAAAFTDAYREANTDGLAEQWNRYAFYLAVVHVIPRYEAQGLQWVTLLPHQCDVLKDVGESDPSILVYATECHGASFVAVDSERWVWIDSAWQTVHEEEHGLGLRPWVTFRWKAPPEFDYWDSGSGQDLYDATMEIARVSAHKRWVRHNWSKKLHKIHLGENVQAANNQNTAANAPVVTRGDGDSKFEVHDTIVGMGEFIAQQQDIIKTLCDGYGLPSNAIDDRTESTQNAANVYGPAKLNLHEALVKLRNKQVKHFEKAEAELAVRAAALLRKHGRMKLTDEQVRAAFRVRFIPMSFADHPKERVATAKEQISLGLLDYYENYQLENPGTTYAEAKEYVDANFATNAKLMSELVSRNATLDPEQGLQSAAQINGRIGGEKSGTVRTVDDTQENPS